MSRLPRCMNQLLPSEATVYTLSSPWLCVCSCLSWGSDMWPIIRGSQRGLSTKVERTSGKLGNDSGGAKQRSRAGLQRWLGSGEDPENFRGCGGPRMDDGKNMGSGDSRISVGPRHLLCASLGYLIPLSFFIETRCKRLGDNE